MVCTRTAQIGNYGVPDAQRRQSLVNSRLANVEIDRRDALWSVLLQQYLVQIERSENCNTLTKATLLTYPGIDIGN